MILVNLGCGRTRHAEWINLDVEPPGSDVRRWDVRKPLPFPDGSVDMVYHSHLLEHLEADDGRNLIKDCFRALKPGGILRVAVPDLAGIAEAYLEARVSARQDGDTTMLEWTRMELVDQATRGVSGGEMLRWLRSRSSSELAIVRSRAGVEVDDALERGATAKLPTFARVWRRFRKEALRVVALALGGRNWAKAVDEGLFRQGGEVHRTMYDDLRLIRLLLDAGFENARVVNASESCLPDFNRFGLDVVDGKVRKPDSLFVEARKG
jgi:SAM-dependent methyltransferase